VAIVDIDNFKTVNDTFGHNAGDAVLREVARRIAGSARVEDVVGRWGGEEFIVILPHCGVGGAADVGERIRRAVSVTPVRGDLGGWWRRRPRLRRGRRRPFRARRRGGPG